MFTPNVTIIHKTTALVQYFMADQRDLISPIHEFHSKCQEEHVHSINLLEVGYIDKYVANPWCEFNVEISDLKFPMIGLNQTNTNTFQL